MSNSHDPSRGNTADRRSRRRYVLEAYRADVDAITIQHIHSGTVEVWFAKSPADQAIMLDQLDDDRAINVVGVDQACRCYRCGELLTIITLTIDRIVPGSVKTRRYPNGGTYCRENIRPSCTDCANKQGGELSAESRNRLSMVRPSVQELAARYASPRTGGKGPVPVSDVQASGAGDLRRNGQVGG